MTISKQQLDEIARQRAEQNERSKSLKKPTHTHTPIDVKSDEKGSKSAAALFEQLFKDQKGYQKPKNNSEGGLSCKFLKVGDAEKFFTELAKKGGKGIIFDGKTKTVMGYYRDGKLYHHPNGNECKPGDRLQASKTPAKGFRTPEPTAPSTSPTGP